MSGVKTDGSWTDIGFDNDNWGEHIVNGVSAGLAGGGTCGVILGEMFKTVSYNALDGKGFSEEFGNNHDKMNWSFADPGAGKLGSSLVGLLEELAKEYEKDHPKKGDSPNEDLPDPLEGVDTFLGGLWYGLKETAGDVKDMISGVMGEFSKWSGLNKVVDSIDKYIDNSVLDDIVKSVIGGIKVFNDKIAGSIVGDISQGLKGVGQSIQNWVKHGEFGANTNPRVRAKIYLEAIQAKENAGQPLNNDEVRALIMAKKALGQPLTDEDYAKIETKETKLREETNMQNYVNNIAESYGRDSKAVMEEMLKLNGCDSVAELQAKVARGESIVEASDTAWNAGIQKQHYAGYDKMLEAQKLLAIQGAISYQNGLQMFRDGEKYRDWGKNFSFSEAVNNGNYIDINVSVGWGLGFTGGVIIDNEQNARFYVGGGIVSGGGITMTWSPNQVTEGFNIGVQGNAFIGFAGQIGYSNGSFKIWENPSWGNIFFEKGGGVATNGVAITGYYIFEPFYNFRK